MKKIVAVIGMMALMVGFCLALSCDKNDTGLLRIETIPPEPVHIFANGEDLGLWSVNWVKYLEGNYTLSFSSTEDGKLPLYYSVTYWDKGGNKGTTVYPAGTPLKVIGEEITTEVKVYFGNVN